MAINGKRLWFDQTFRRVPASPAQVEYETRLKQALPRIQRVLLARQGQSRKELAAQLAEIQTLYKQRKFADALKLLVTLHDSLDDVDTARTPSTLPAVQQVQERSEALNASGIKLPAELAERIPKLGSDDGAEAQNLLKLLDDFEEQRDSLRAEAELLGEHARTHHLDKPQELDSKLERLRQALDTNLQDAAKRLDELRNLVDTNDELRDHYLEAVEDIRQWMAQHGADMQVFEAAAGQLADFLDKGDFLSAKSCYEQARGAFAGMADLPRLKDVLEKLQLEASDRGVDGKLLDTLVTQAETSLKKQDQKGAQAAVTRIREAIAERDAALSPADREKLDGQRMAKRLQNRLKRVQEWARDPDAPKEIARVAEELAACSTPPPDTAKQARAAELYAKATVLSGHGRFEKVGGSANGVFALTTKDRIGKGDKSKQFFKPISKEKDQPGFPKGGGAVREVLGKVAADKLVAMTGLPIHVAETSMVELPPEALPPELASEGPVVGSMQHNIHRKGDAPQRTLGAVGKEQADLYARIPKQKIQAKQVFDLAVLNLDVHGENIYVKGEGEEAQLDGIDNGMALPSKQGLLLRAEAFGVHALNGAPANDEPMDPSVVEAVQRIDEKALEQAMRDSLAEMKKRFAGKDVVDDKLLNDEHIEVMKASVRFLKQAVRELTMNQIQQAYLVHLQSIFGMDGDDTRGEADRFGDVIRAVKDPDASEALKKCLADTKNVIAAAKAAKWMVTAPYQRGTNLIEGNLIRFYPRQYLAIQAGKALPGPLSTPISAPKLQPEQLAAAYADAGGDAAVQRLGGALSASPAFGMMPHRFKHLLELQAIHAAMKAVPV